MARRDIGSGGGDSSVTQGTIPWIISIDQTGSNNDVDILSIAAGSNLIGKVQLRNPANTADMGDATNPVRVDPTGSTTQPVSGTVTANQGTPNTVANSWFMSITDGVRTASVRDTGSSDALNVAIVDAAGEHITSFGGGTQYTEGDIDASITGTALMFESNTGTNRLDVVNSSTPLPVADALAEASLAIIDDWDESDRAKVNLIVGQAGITAGAGAVAANTPRITHASDDPVTTALQIIDDWDESDRAKVNPIAGQAGVQGGSGTVSALTQRVCLATDVALPAGTNNIQGVRKSTQVLTAINTTYDDSPTTATSADFAVGNARTGMFYADVTESGAGQSITFKLRISHDGTNFGDYRCGPWARYSFNSATISAHGTLKIAIPFVLNGASHIHMVVTCTGTDATNSITVANAYFSVSD